MWYVVQVLCGQERVTLELVERFVDRSTIDEVFIPKREIMRHCEGEWVRLRETLFPGYLFVATRHPEKLLAELVGVSAFTRLLGSNESFVPLAPEEERVIRAMMGDDHVIEVSEGIIEGDEVRVLRGPLRDVDVVIEKIDRHKRCAYVRLPILGRDTSIKLGLDIIRKTS